MSETLLAFLVAVPGVALALVAWVMSIGINRRLHDAQTRIEAMHEEFELLRQSISGLTAGALGVDRRVRQLEQRGKELAERQDSYEIQHADERPYGHAIRLVQQGASARRLVTELELSESEADLIVRMHGRRDSA